jgi:hypothetical protein
LRFSRSAICLLLSLLLLSTSAVAACIAHPWATSFASRRSHQLLSESRGGGDRTSASVATCLLLSVLAPRAIFFGSAHARPIS